MFEWIGLRATNIFDEHLSYLSLVRTCSFLFWMAPLASLFAFCFFFVSTHPEYSINFYDCNRQNHFHWVRIHTHAHTQTEFISPFRRLRIIFLRFSVFLSHFESMKNVLPIENCMNNQYLKWWEKKHWGRWRWRWRRKKEKPSKKNANINFNITFLSQRSATATAILCSCALVFVSFCRNLQSVLILFQTSREIMYEC